MGRGLHRAILALATAALAGPWLAAGASPGDAKPRRTLRLDPPFVPSIDPAEIPGFKMKIRGERIVYCRMERRTGTRFRTELCIDQDRIGAWLEALEANQRQVRELPTSGETRIN